MTLVRVAPSEVHAMMRITLDPEHGRVGTVDSVRKHSALGSGLIYEFALQEGGSYYADPETDIWVQP